MGNSSISNLKYPYSRPQLLSLPPELMHIIIQLLSREDQQIFSLLSQSSRQLALPFLFCELTYTLNVATQIENINQVNEGIKATIREITLDESYQTALTDPIVFRFLKSLPKLRVFRWCRPRGVSTSLNELVASLDHCPLEHFEYWVNDVPCGPATAPSGLKSLSLKFNRASLFDLIQPSFSTLVELRIRPLFPVYSTSCAFDLLPLRPVGGTLQKFSYKAPMLDPEMLDTIPEVFPHLTSLELMYWKGPRGSNLPLWEKSYDDAISRNIKLQNLTVYAGEFVFCDTPPRGMVTACRACADQRAKATHVLAIACTGLKRCTWDNMGTRYMFDVKLVDSADGNALFQVDRHPSVSPLNYTVSWFGGVDLTL